MKNETDLLIREANENDVPMILQFIRELAEFEKLSHEVVATEDSDRGLCPRAVTSL